MTPFEHLSVLISIVIGLGLTQLLTDVEHLVQARAQVRRYWLSILWSCVLFGAMVEWWWAFFGLKGHVDWNFFYFLFVLLSPAVLYLAVAFALPSVEKNEPVDMRAYYWETKQYFFMLLAASTMLDAIRRAIDSGSIRDFGAWTNGVSAVLVASLAVSKNEKYHAVISIGVTLLFVFFIGSAALELK